MRVLVAGRHATLLAALARTFANDLKIAIATTLAQGLGLLEEQEFDVVLACENLSGGSGLQILSHVAVNSPDSLRIFAARPATLHLLKGELGLFGLFRTLNYPIDARKLAAALKLARGCLETEAEPLTVRHVVLEDEWETHPWKIDFAELELAAGTPPHPFEWMPPNDADDDGAFGVPTIQADPADGGYVPGAADLAHAADAADWAHVADAADVADAAQATDAVETSAISVASAARAQSGPSALSMRSAASAASVASAASAASAAAAASAASAASVASAASAASVASAASAASVASAASAASAAPAASVTSAASAASAASPASPASPASAASVTLAASAATAAAAPLAPASAPASLSPPRSPAESAVYQRALARRNAAKLEVMTGVFASTSTSTSPLQSSAEPAAAAAAAAIPSDRNRGSQRTASERSLVKLAELMSRPGPPAGPRKPKKPAKRTALFIGSAVAAGLGVAVAALILLNTGRSMANTRSPTSASTQRLVSGGGNLSWQQNIQPSNPDAINGGATRFQESNPGTSLGRPASSSGPTFIPAVSPAADTPVNASASQSPDEPAPRARAEYLQPPDSYEAAGRQPGPPPGYSQPGPAFFQPGPPPAYAPPGPSEPPSSSAFAGQPESALPQSEQR